MILISTTLITNYLVFTYLIDKYKKKKDPQILIFYFFACRDFL